jgi:phenylpropionate dioxygenase-like ring-hydroxylating dioxygenase large terminal subunit
METQPDPFLRNTWYVAALSEEVTNRPVGRRILGDPIVLYRTADGSCAALSDRCCHRGVPLSLGSVVDDCLQCAYHGFTFDRTGQCVRVPSQKTPPPAARVKGYPVLEKHGFLWIWMGGEPPKPQTLPDLDAIASPQWTTIRGVLTIAADYQRVIDNILDLSHVSFVHRSTFGSDDVLAKLHFEEIQGSIAGVRTGPPMPTPPLYRRLGFSDSIQQTKRLIYELPCHVKAPVQTVDAQGEGAAPAIVFVFNSLTPQTHRSCHYYWSSSRNFAPDDSTVSELMREQTLRAFHEDQLIVEAEERSHHEGFQGGTAVAADIGGVMARRLLARRIREESQASKQLPAASPISH